MGDCAASIIENDSDCDFIACIPRVIRADWDDKFAPLLAGFPVNLVFTKICQPRNTNEPPQFDASCYQFDPCTFHENAEKRQMSYHSRANPEFSVEVVIPKRSSEIVVSKFRGEIQLWVASGASFDGAMLQATLMGMAGDEVEDAPWSVSLQHGINHSREKPAQRAKIATEAN